MKKVKLECGGCDAKYTVSYKVEEDVKEVEPVICPFCGEDVYNIEEPDDHEDDDDSESLDGLVW